MCIQDEFLLTLLCVPNRRLWVFHPLEPFETTWYLFVWKIERNYYYTHSGCAAHPFIISISLLNSFNKLCSTNCFYSDFQESHTDHKCLETFRTQRERGETLSVCAAFWFIFKDVDLFGRSLASKMCSSVCMYCPCIVMMSSKREKTLLIVSFSNNSQQHLWTFPQDAQELNCTC